MRFEQLCKIGIKPGSRLLDVGCGFGDLLEFLDERGIQYGDYQGLDLSPDLLETARERHREANFFEGDLFDLDPHSGQFDYALLSGSLNEMLGDDGSYARQTITRMFDASRRGIALNLLDATHLQTGSRPDLQSFDPEQMATWCRDLTPETTQIRGYLDNDFTLLLQRKP
ncbi:class I SAM-dependent methyltransferase [Candidatus Reidiella endopervernicosa]|uniref:class I SAM-dependent methyltransferase n=1 Tax=Candidatus Reidiella endopervernicosa TaxID=2738883 RepID=UPI001EF01A81|nr:class I SAM-dependent methyltransferase [Candidatus Reidiella endopervernicosa]